MTKLLTAAAETGDIEAALDCLLESFGNVIQHVLHIIDRRLLITSAEDDLIVFGEVVVYRKGIVIGINTDISTRRKSDPFRSAMSMLVFYINRAGKKLAEDQKDILQQAKDELR